ncbi:DUF1905 domain-containing protein [Cryobacterium algoritolerans]|uniref:DUF1905 domain-containing protein n=1 Tax=Cryobacterium algoritolerans TaxID=1259184 RepID=A0A4R8WH77_9MICO|nr:YdeI/OmpD-associated family protein [Cryobacterium algoritolerans]TFC09683.1 DUF1905 domain-containing protein [Cryobacterium algoritolerans]
MRFTTVLELGGKTATGIRVPDEVFASLGAGRRYPVVVTIGVYSHRSSVAPYRGAFMIAMSEENRARAEVAAGEEIEVDLTLDTEPREVEVPADLAALLDAKPGARVAFEALSYSNQRRHVLAVEGATADETRQRRILAALAELTTPYPAA